MNWAWYDAWQFLSGTLPGRLILFVVAFSLINAAERIVRTRRERRLEKERWSPSRREDKR